MILCQFGWDSVSNLFAATVYRWQCIHEDTLRPNILAHEYRCDYPESTLPTVPTFARHQSDGRASTSIIPWQVLCIGSSEGLLRKRFL